MESETKRLKTRLAANSGDADLMAFLWQSTSDSPSYVDELKRRLACVYSCYVLHSRTSWLIADLFLTSTVEEQAAALEKTLAGRADAAKAEAEVRRQLAQVQKQLERYQAVYGDASSMSPETAQLSEQLQHKQDELDRLHLQDRNREQVTTISALMYDVSLTVPCRPNLRCTTSWTSFHPRGKRSIVR